MAGEILYDLSDELFLHLLKFCDKDCLRALTQVDKSVRSAINRLWRDTRYVSEMEKFRWRSDTELPKLRGAAVVGQTWLAETAKDAQNPWNSVAINCKLIIELAQRTPASAEGPQCSESQQPFFRSHFSRKKRFSVLLWHSGNTNETGLDSCVVLVDGRDGAVSRRIYQEREIIDARFLECSIGGADFPHDFQSIRHIDHTQLRALKLTFDDYSSQYIAFRHSPKFFPRRTNTTLDQIRAEISDSSVPELVAVCKSAHRMSVINDERRLMAFPYRYWYAESTNTRTTTFHQGMVDVLGRWRKGVKSPSKPCMQEMGLLTARSAYDLVNVQEEERWLRENEGPPLILHCLLPEYRGGPTKRFGTLIMTQNDVALLQGLVSTEQFSSLPKSVDFRVFSDCYEDSPGFPFLTNERESGELTNLHHVCHAEKAVEEWSLIVVLKARIGLDWSELLDQEGIRVASLADLDNYYIIKECWKTLDDEFLASYSAIKIWTTDLFGIRRMWEDVIHFTRNMVVAAVGLRVTKPSLKTMTIIQENMTAMGHMESVLALNSDEEKPVTLFIRQLENIKNPDSLADFSKLLVDFYPNPLSLI